MIQTYFVESGSKAFYSNCCFSSLCYKSNVGNKVQFLVVNRSSVINSVAWFVDRKNRVCSVFVRASTVKQWILYQTCTGPVVQLLANVYHVVNKNMIGSTY